MRGLLSLLLVVGCLMMSFTLPNQSEVRWLTLEEAMAQSKIHPKKIFVDIYTDWCTWCKKMEKFTFNNPYIANYINDKFYPVKIDAEMSQSVYFKGQNYIFRPGEGRKGRGVHELAIYLTRGRLSYPSVVFLDENLNNPQPVAGFQNPARMDMLLKFFGEDYYKYVDWNLFRQIYKSPIDWRTQSVPRQRQMARTQQRTQSATSSQQRVAKTQQPVQPSHKTTTTQPTYKTGVRTNTSTQQHYNRTTPKPSTYQSPPEPRRVGSGRADY